MLGIARIANTYMFNDVNNVGVYTLHDSFDFRYMDMFGFTEDELSVLLTIAGIDPSEGDALRRYSDGYEAFWYQDMSRSVKLYNPWSVMNSICSSHHLEIIPHWTATGVLRISS